MLNISSTALAEMSFGKKKKISEMENLIWNGESLEELWEAEKRVLQQEMYSLRNMLLAWLRTQGASKTET